MRKRKKVRSDLKYISKCSYWQDNDLDWNIYSYTTSSPFQAIPSRSHQSAILSSGQGYMNFVLFWDSPMELIMTNVYLSNRAWVSINFRMTKHLESGSAFRLRNDLQLQYGRAWNVDSNTGRTLTTRQRGSERRSVFTVLREHSMAPLHRQSSRSPPPPRSRSQLLSIVFSADTERLKGNQFVVGNY